jgi:hypothetical protein
LPSFIAAFIDIQDPVAHGDRCGDDLTAKARRGMALYVEVSAGELLDKLTILEIKAARIQDPAKLANVHKELKSLRAAWSSAPCSRIDVSTPIAALKSVNEALWDIEDEIRRKEARQEFDREFIELARSVYHRNDERAAIKRELNRLLDSDLVEEKSYTDYGQSAERTSDE